MALTKVHNRMLQGSQFHVDDYGAVGDGVTDDTAAIQAALDAAEAARPPQAEAYVEFGTGRVYLVSSKINVLNVSINGNGGTLLSNTPITIMEINGNSQMYTDFNLRFSSEQSNPAAIALKLTDGVQQASKNTYTNIITRNAYTGFYNDGGSGAAGSIWGSIFQNCRAEFCYDWAWYFDAALGATTCHFDTCYARGSNSGSQSKGFYINNIADIVMTNIAVDQVNDGSAIQINTSSQVVIDTIALESCFVTSAGQNLISLSANQVIDVKSISNKVCTYNVGVGNNAYIVSVGSGSEVRIGSIRDVSSTVTSGTVYKIRGSTTARIRTQDVPLSEVDTFGNYELFFDFGRFKGLATASPAGTWTGTYEVGDVAWNRSPTAGGVEPIGWVCTVAGTPGTWAGFGTIA
jgi:hypothetical protein